MGIAVNPPLAKPLELLIRSDVVGVSPPAILGSGVSPQRIAPIARARLQERGGHQGRGSAWAWDGPPPYRMDRPYPLYFLISVQKICMSKKLAGSW